MKRQGGEDEQQPKRFDASDLLSPATSTSSEGHGKGERDNRLFTADGCEATTITLVYDEGCLKSGGAKRRFHPDMCHQIFGPNESVYGYRNLSIDLYYMANSHRCLAEVTYTEEVQEEAGLASLTADPVMDRLVPWLPYDYTVDRDQFTQQLAIENSTLIFGEVLREFMVDGTKYKITVNRNIDQSFADFHARFQTLIIWFIDAANLIDVMDQGWTVVYLYEEGVAGGKRDCFYPVGFCTIFNYYHYPNMVRPRISQFFIIPPCQRKGLGTVLLKTCYQVIYNMGNVIDISVESPSTVFRSMRDTLDCTLLMQLKEFTPPFIKTGFKKQMVLRAAHLFKINRGQCHRVYQILRMYYLLNDEKSTEYINFRMEVHRSYSRYELPRLVSKYSARDSNKAAPKTLCMPTPCKVSRPSESNTGQSSSSINPDQITMVYSNLTSCPSTVTSATDSSVSGQLPVPIIAPIDSHLMPPPLTIPPSTGIPVIALPVNALPPDAFVGYAILANPVVDDRNRESEHLSAFSSETPSVLQDPRQPTTGFPTVPFSGFPKSLPHAKTCTPPAVKPSPRAPISDKVGSDPFNIDTHMKEIKQAALHLVAHLQKCPNIPTVRA